MTTMSKGWRDGDSILAIKNNQHASNKYSKVSLIEDNICKLYGHHSPWGIRYLPLSLTATTTYQIISIDIGGLKEVDSISHLPLF